MRAAWASLVLLFAAAVAGAVIVQAGQLDAAIADGRVVNLAGRQRMLSQRIARFAGAARTDSAARGPLSEAAARLDREYGDLRRLVDSVRGIGVPDAESIATALDATVPARRALLHVARAATIGDAEADAAGRAADALLAGMERTVSAGERFQRAYVRRAMHTTWMIGGAFALFLCFVAAPFGEWIVRVVRRQQDALVQRARELSFLATAATHTRHAVVFTDPARRITWVNDGFERVTGYARAAVLGRSPGALLQGPETDPAVPRAIRTALDAGKPFTGEILNVDRAGQPYWLDLDIQPVRGSDGAITGFVAVETDITERKASARALEVAQRDVTAANEQLRAINRELAASVEESRRLAEAAEQASRAKSAFLANMSHEIRTPLTAVLGFTEELDSAIAAQLPPDVTRAQVRIIHRAGGHLLGILNDILDLARIEEGELAVVTEVVELPSLLMEVESLFRAAARERHIGLRVEVDGPIPQRIRTDGTRLRQIVMNLVGNAVKFTDDGGVTIVVRVVYGASAPAMLSIGVVDSGKGIDRETAERLFEPFTQGAGAARRGGTGLGLSISRRLARALGGDVTLEHTAPGVGSRFAVQVPLTPVDDRTVTTLEPAGDVAPVAPVEDSRGLAGVRILLADDGDVNRLLFERILTRAGAAVVAVADGASALEVLDAGTTFDLLVTDVQMPQIDGIALTRLVRARGWRMPVMALTAAAMPEDRESCLAAGCDAVHTKPIARAELVSACATLVGRAGAVPSLRASA
ncbi:MAG: ATP-binding protein [Gemmatimonadaceae bacterium]|nr:ATP-binding protein [Gemmatimonadaceae bacterium]